LSDIHLKPQGVLAYDVANTSAALVRAVDHINNLNPRPDVVLATGDLVDEGESESYDTLGRLLAPLQPPLYIVPGNHDHKLSLEKAFPNHEYLQTPIREGDNHYICYTVDKYPVRFIGLDTVTPGKHGGGLGPLRLDWLEHTLGQKPEVPTIIFMHHPPFASAIGHMDKQIFEGRKELSNLIEMYPNVDRLLCGHIHRPFFRQFGGTIAAGCPGIGMQLVLDLRVEAPSAFIMEPPAIMLHLYANPWNDDLSLMTYVSVVEETSGQYGGSHPFFGEVFPK
ncbi:MAG: phosphodiesterase, partial [Planctomycetota bacterium]